MSILGLKQFFNWVLFYELWSILHSANLYLLQMKQIKGILGTSVESRIF